MAVEIKMPQLSDTMHAGKIVSWSKREGDTVERGEAIAEVETDKANLQIESFHKGVILKILTPVNSTAKVGEVIALVGQAGESVSAPPSSAAKPAVIIPVTSATPATPISQPTVAAPAPAATPPAAVVADSAHASTGRVKASPLARKLASDRNIDLAIVRGTGPEGRIVRRDIESAGQGQAQPTGTAVSHHQAPAPVHQPLSTPPTVSSATTAHAASVAGTLTPFSRMRDTIARRMQEAVRDYPHFYVTTSINMGEAIRLREHLKAKEEFKGITINHLVIKAAAYALAHEPRVNRAVRDNQMYEPGQINIGIITAVDDGLLIPVIKEANRLTLKDLVFEARAATERAKAGRPNSSDLTGGTFSISNLGMFDVENFTAIINPGQGAVLAVSSVKEEPVVEHGQIVIGKRMRVTLSVDHRVIDGVMGGKFLQFLKEALELPALLMA